VASLLTMKDAIEAVEEGFREFALGNVKMPVRSSVSTRGGVMFTMPAYVGGKANALGQKIVTVYPDNPAEHNLPTTLATVELLNPQTGECLTIMDGGFLTAIRTGAVSGVATKYLARTSSTRVAIFGAGAQAQTQLEAAAEVRKIEAAKVFDTVPGRAREYCERMSSKLKVELEEGRTPRDTVRGADIIICASTSSVPVFSGEWLEPGMHINGIGSFRPDIRELDTVSVQRSKVVVDSADAALSEAGDLIMPIAEKAISAGHIWAELGEIILGKKAGRTSEQEITLFKSVGLALQDVSTALMVYKRAIEQGRGINVTL